MTKRFMIRVFSVLVIFITLLYVVSCGIKDVTDHVGIAGSTTGIEEESSGSESYTDIRKGGSDKAGIYRVILMHADSPYRPADAKISKTDMIAFQILSVKSDGSFGKAHNFMPEYEVSFDGKENLVIKVMGKLTDEYEEIDMDMSKSTYLSNYEKTVSDDYITFKFKTKTAVKFKVVEYFMDFIDFYIEVYD